MPLRRILATRRSRSGRKDALGKRSTAPKHRSARTRLAARLETLESRRLLAFDFGVVTDVNTLGLSSDPEQLTEVAGDVFFVANDGVSGDELFVSDSSGQNVRQVADLRPGPIGSNIENLTNVGGRLYFTASADGQQNDLWTSDGTTSGTVKVFDASDASVYSIDQVTGVGNRVFFTAYQDATGYELWTSDGTTSGTVLTRDINQVQDSPEGPTELTAVGNELFFAASSYYNTELWKSDGTAAGTVLVADIDGDSFSSSYPEGLTESNGLLYFAADTPGFGLEPYRSDGTAAGTFRLANIAAGDDSSQPREFTTVGNETFFVADTGTTAGLYSTTGSGVTAIATPGIDASDFSPTDLTAVGNRLFFAAGGAGATGPISVESPALTATNSFQYQLNRTAGVVTGTFGADRGTLLIEPPSNVEYNFPPMDGSNDGPGFVTNGQIGNAGVGLTSIQPGDLVLQWFNIFNGAPFDPSTPVYEWTLSDPGGLTDISFGGFASGNEFDEFNEGLVFELFLNNSSTPSQTQLVAGDALDNYFGGRDSGNISLATPGGNTVTTATVRMSFGTGGATSTAWPDARGESVIVGATLSATGGTSGVSGREVFVYDGSGVSLVDDIVLGASSNPSALTAVGDDLVFVANDPVGGFGQELFVIDSNNVAGGAAVLADVRPGVDAASMPLSSEPVELTVAGNNILFSAVGTTGGRELYISNPASGSAGLAADINLGTAGSNPSDIVVTNDNVFYVANNGVSGDSIYSVNPTGAAAAGSPLVDLTDGLNDQIIGLAALPNGQLVFGHREEGLLALNPSNGSVTSLSSVVPQRDGEDVFEVLGSTAFFAATSTNSGVELWRTDGIDFSTFEAADVRPGVIGSNPTELTAFDGALYFAADGPVGVELYRYAGFGPATLVQDIYPEASGSGQQSSFPGDLTVSGNHLFFAASDNRPESRGGTGRELYSLAAGANLPTLIELQAGNGSGNNTETESSNPQNLTDINGTLYFNAFSDDVVLDPGSNVLRPAGFELFTSDGTVAGTTLRVDVVPGTGSSNPDDFFAVGNQVYFTATTPTTGRELFVMNAGATTATLVADLRPGTRSSNPELVAELSDNRLLFSADASNFVGRELYVTGGSINGVLPVAELNPGPGSGDPDQFVRLGDNGTGRILFTGTSPAEGNELRELVEVPPAVTEVIINEGDPQRSALRTIDVVFNSPVDLSGAVIRIDNLTTGNGFNAAAVVTSQSADRLVARLQIPASATTGGNLDNGNYQLSINGSSITSFGTPLQTNAGNRYVFGADAADNFFQLYGDTNGDRVVSIPDLLDFRMAYASRTGQPSFQPELDANNSGVIDLPDLIAFRNTYGVRI